jgi:hypothetical protein
MKIHKGTVGADKRPCRWIEPRTTWQFSLNDLIDGLCSYYWRHRTADDETDPLPETLSLDDIVRTVKEEFESYGLSNTWTWCEQVYSDSVDEARTWATRLILAVLPDIDVPKES